MAAPSKLPGCGATGPGCFLQRRYLGGGLLRHRSPACSATSEVVNPSAGATVQSARVSCWLARLLSNLQALLQPAQLDVIHATSAANDTCIGQAGLCSAGIGFRSIHPGPQAAEYIGLPAGIKPGAEAVARAARRPAALQEPEAPAGARCQPSAHPPARDCCNAAWALRTEVLAARPR